MDLVRLRPALDELESVWVEAGDQATLMPLNPGADESHVREVWSDLPWQVPAEAVVWWGWHDGSVQGRGPTIGGAHLEFLTVTEARRQYEVMLDLAAEVAEKPRSRMTAKDWTEHGYEPSWIPVAVGLGGDLVTLDASAGYPASVRAVSAGDWEPHKIDADSLLDVVEGWLDLYRVGFYRRDDDQWVHDMALLPKHMRPFW